jgi:hypothetical protein
MSLDGKCKGQRAKCKARLVESHRKERKAFITFSAGRGVG